MAGVPRHHRGRAAKVHLFPSPAALAAYCRTSTDHDLADHPVWPVVAGLGAADLTPDDDHRYDLDGVYDIAAESPDRWAVEELAATIDIVSRLAECLDTSPEPRRRTRRRRAEGQFEAVAELAAKPEIGSLGLGVDAFVGRSGEDAWLGVGGVLDDLWEDVVEELSEHLDWTGAGTATLEDYPPASEVEEVGADDLPDDVVLVDDDEPADAPAAAPVRTIARGGRITASPAEVADAGRFWESVGILPVEVVVPDGAGVTLRCYVEDVARFLGRDGDIYLFDTPADLARFCAGSEDHDLSEIASWPEVADTDVPPLPSDQDRYDLSELSEALTEVADGAAGLVDHRAFAQPVEGVRDLAEYAGLARVEELLSPDVAAGPRGGPRRARPATPSCAPRTPPSCARCGTRSSPWSAESSSSATDPDFRAESPRHDEAAGPGRSRDRPLRRSGCWSAAVARGAAGPPTRARAPVTVGTLARRAVAVGRRSPEDGSPAGRGRSPNERRGPPRLPPVGRSPSRRGRLLGPPRTAAHVALRALLRLHRDALGDEVEDRRRHPDGSGRSSGSTLAVRNRRLDCPTWSGSSSETTTPAAPARAVRPERCR